MGEGRRRWEEQESRPATYHESDSDEGMVGGTGQVCGVVIMGVLGVDGDVVCGA